MTRVLFLLFSSLYLAVVDVNGHSRNEIDLNDYCTVKGSCTVFPGDEFRNHNEVLWTGRLPSIALQVKNEAQAEKRGTTSKIYYSVRQPPKKIDKTLRKKTGHMHKMVVRGVSTTDKHARKGAMVAHDAVKDMIIGVDRGLSRGSKMAHNALKKSSNWLDHRLVQGSKKTHSAVKHTAIPVHNGVAQGSVTAYGTVRKSIAAIDKQLQNSVRAVDRQMMPVKFFLNQFVSTKNSRLRFGKKKSKDSEPTITKEGEPLIEGETEAAPTAIKDEPAASEMTSSPSPTPVSSVEDLPDHHAEEKLDHKEEEPMDDFDMGDDNNVEEPKDKDDHKDAKLKDSDESEADDGHKQSHEVDEPHPKNEGEVRTIAPFDRKKSWDYEFDDTMLKQIRAMPRTIQRNVPQSFTKIKSNASKSLSKINMPPLTKMSKSLSKMPRSLSEMPGSLSKMNVSPSLSKMNLPRSFPKVNVPRSLSSKVRAPRTLKPKHSLE